MTQMNELLHLDSWANLTTGVGGPKDKSSGFAFSPTFIGDDWNTLEVLYEQEHLCGRIVDALPDAVFARGWILEMTDHAAREAVIDCIDELDAEAAVHQAMCYERLHGGAAIFVGTDDVPFDSGKRPRFDEPLREAAVRNVLYLHVLDRWELTPARLYQDAAHPKFGQPSHYRVHPTEVGMSQQVGVIVHESRLILFKGEQTTKRKRIEQQGWGQSVLVRVYTAVKQYGGSMSSTLALMADASQGVYKIKGLLDIIRGGNEESLIKRMRVMERVRSTLNAVLLDAEGEDYARIATTLTELGNLIDRFQVQVASAAAMPVTELFGKSAAGMNATGENDTRSWYDKVTKVQRTKGQPALERILRLLMRSKLGPTNGVEPASWSVKFPPVWQPTALEAATMRKTKVETAAILQDMQVVTPAQVARALLSGSEWDSEIVLKPEELKALELTQMLSGATPQLPSVPTPVDSAQITQDDEGEELSYTNPRELAAKMTDLGIARCEHGKVNRCQMCGIERQRDVEIGTDGQPAFALKWRAIGERLPVIPDPVQPDA